jgi:hypothetical protein
MRRLAMFLTVGAAACALLSARAWTAGSIPFGEVMGLARHNSKLVKEIAEVMRAQKVKPADISCEAGRFGNHWKHLGGGRSLPISCTIGKRSLGIVGDVEYLDARGKVIVGGMDNPRVFGTARNTREKNLTWEWNDD